MATRAVQAGQGALKSQLVLLLVVGLSMICAVLASIVVARAAGAAEFGFFALLATLLPIARDLTDLGTANVTARKISRSPATEADSLAELLAWRRVPAGAAALMLFGLALVQSSQPHAWILFGGALVAMLYVNGAYLAPFQARNQFAVPSAITAATQIATLAACVVLAAVSARPIAYPVTILLREAAAMLMLRAAAAHLIGSRPNRQRAVPLRSHFGSLGTVSVAAFSYQLAIGCGPLIVQLACDPVQLGQYGAAFRLASPLFAIGWMLAAPWVPSLAISGDIDRGEAARAVYRMTALPLALASAGTGFLFASSPTLVRLLFGEAFSASTRILQVLGIAVGANFVGAFVVTALISVGCQQVALSAGLLMFVLSFGGTLVLVPFEGALGAAHALALACTVATLVAAIKMLGLARTMRMLAVAVVTSLIVSVGGLLVPLSTIAQILCLGAIAAVAATASWAVLRHE